MSFRQKQQLLKTFVLRALLKFVWKIRDQFFIKLVGFKTSSFSAILYFKMIQEDYDTVVSRKFDTAGILI